jgi:RNA polymerase sigma-70 factor (ECF subfamily)
VTERPIEELFTTTYPRLVSIAYAVTRDLPEAQDVAQEAFEKLVGRPPVICPEAWLRTVTLNIAIGKRRRRLRLDELVKRVFSEPQQEIPRSVERLSILAALKELPSHLKETLVLFYYCDLSIVEVAAAQRVPVGTVKARLFRGRAALAALLTDTVAAAA